MDMCNENNENENNGCCRDEWKNGVLKILGGKRSFNFRRQSVARLHSKEATFQSTTATNKNGMNHSKTLCL